MSNNKDIVLTTINDTKDEIKNFMDELKAKRKQLPDIKAIANSLTGAEKVIKNINKLCNEEIKSLELIINTLTYTQIKELLNKTDIMFDVINDNLPNGMELRELDENNCSESGKIREIWFDNNKVGHVKILNEVDNILYIEVTINDFVDKFEVVKPNRMYHIISFINTKYNYE